MYGRYDAVGACSVLLKPVGCRTLPRRKPLFGEGTRRKADAQANQRIQAKKAKDLLKLRLQLPEKSAEPSPDLTRLRPLLLPHKQ